MKKDLIIILDFGSQYSHLIARRIRDIGVYTLLFPYNISIFHILEKKPKGIILSGGPNSVYEKKSPFISKKLLESGIPILGICYGMQLIATLFKGKVEKSYYKEYGRSFLRILEPKNLLFLEIPTKKLISVWMSHFDEIKVLPKEFKIIASTQSCNISAIAHKKKNIYAVQFHPEVKHTDFGNLILKNFIIRICKCETNWKLEDFIEKTIDKIKNIVNGRKVILGLSGGVDSFVTACLIKKAIKNSLICIFIDTGFFLEREKKHIHDLCKKFNLSLRFINAQKHFLSKLNGIANPEIKRKIIGKEFIYFFQKESKKIQNVNFLAQGTIYSDVIESSTDLKGFSNPIKSHHNVGGLPKSMKLKLIEPLKKLFKDEVKKIGKILGIPQIILDKHPFPGPGLSIRIIGKINKKKINILKKAENILFQELINNNLYNFVNQCFIVLLPIKSVGVMGDKRSYEYTAVLRSVNTEDFMTANFSFLSMNFLERISNRIINEVDGINRMLYDISSKPPATIEWE